jgi:hypothetical protein
MANRTSALCIARFLAPVSLSIALASVFQTVAQPDLGPSVAGTGIPPWSAIGSRIGAALGYSVGTAGDVNNDGYSDVIVSAPFIYNGESVEGQVYVYLGSGGGLSSSPHWTIDGDQSHAQLGLSVATAGDVNGDDYADVIVGAPEQVNGIWGNGRAEVYLGSADGLSTTPAWGVVGEEDGDAFGFKVDTAGDVNGDGYDDIIVAAHNVQTGEGRVFVYHGSEVGLSSDPAWTVEGEQVEEYFGSSIGSAGDVNADGFDDVIIGAAEYDAVDIGYRAGRSLVYYGSLNGLSLTADWMVTGTAPYRYWGRAVATAGDVNGDGYDDVVVGERRWAHVFHGSASGLAPTPSWSDNAGVNAKSFGARVAAAGGSGRQRIRRLDRRGLRCRFGAPCRGCRIHLSRIAGRLDGGSGLASGGATGRGQVRLCGRDGRRCRRQRL